MIRLYKSNTKNKMNHQLNTPYSAGEELEMDQVNAHAVIKRLKMLDAKRRQKLLDLGIVSTSDMYALENGERIKNEEELNAFVVKMSNTDTPVDIHTRVEDYGDPRFTPMLKCKGLDLDTSIKETKDDADSVPLEEYITEFADDDEPIAKPVLVRAPRKTDPKSIPYGVGRRPHSPVR